mmetsp:Transcript_49268/g.50044  ORF Transcript_49268/g.50044 Transcript_49268/m.50044 type:complete len:169 (-) Transcript_49268:167-673(-)
MPPPPVMVTMVMMKTTLIIIVHPVVTIQLWRHPFHDEHISVPTQGLFTCLELQQLGKEGTLDTNGICALVQSSSQVPCGCLNADGTPIILIDETDTETNSDPTTTTTNDDAPTSTNTNAIDGDANNSNASAAAAPGKRATTTTTTMNSQVAVVVVTSTISGIMVSLFL